MSSPRILYCHCAHAQVVPAEVKQAVLQHLSDSQTSFEAVADLCEMSARQDPTLQHLAREGGLKIAACYPRAVKWLFHTAGTSLPLEQTEVINMRTLKAEEVIRELSNGMVCPNLPAEQKAGSANASAKPTSLPTT